MSSFSLKNPENIELSIERENLHFIFVVKT